MFKQNALWAGVFAGVILLSGCATGRNYQADIDSLNHRISTLQGELASKDKAIADLQGQLGQQQTALSQAQADKQMLGDKLDAALAQLESQARKTPKKSPYADLK